MCPCIKIRMWFYLLAFVFGLPNIAYAEFITIKAVGTYEERKIELKASERAVLTVYLQSFGEPLQDYTVVLYRDKDKLELSRIVSDDSGEVSFSGLPPGKYTLQVIHPQNLQNKSLVKIGDFRLIKMEK